MTVVRKIKDLRRWIEAARRQNKSIGFVPTMGDLHEGHLSLVRRSRNDNDVTAVSIFVNPGQFDRREDFEKYRRSEREDCEKIGQEGADLAFIPSADELYPEGFQTFVEVENLSRPLCGARRPGHFRGVATVVAKLLNLFQPDRAYFGLKDYQQCQLVRQMVRDLNLPVDIVPCPTVRDGDGLALSSRNRRLTPAERARAPGLHRALLAAAALVKNGGPKLASLRKTFRQNLKLQKSDRVEYLEAADPETLRPLKKIRPPVLIAAAVWFGKTRLIDSVLVSKQRNAYV